jgi:hypothetical protein
VARAEPDDSFDFVIVGSGTAGSLLAARLSEDPRYIPNPADRADHGTLLEVGPHQPQVEIVGDRHGLKEPFELAVLVTCRDRRWRSPSRSRECREWRRSGRGMAGCRVFAPVDVGVEGEAGLLGGAHEMMRRRQDRPVILDRHRAGTWAEGCRSAAPASSSTTRDDTSSLRRLATTHPADPAPTMT